MAKMNMWICGNFLVNLECVAYASCDPPIRFSSMKIYLENNTCVDLTLPTQAVRDQAFTSLCGAFRGAGDSSPSVIHAVGDRVEED